MGTKLIPLNRLTILGDVARFQILSLAKRWLKILLQIIQLEILFCFSNAWELIIKEVDIAGFNFCHTTIRVFPVHHIPLKCAGYLMNTILLALGPSCSCLLVMLCT